MTETAEAAPVQAPVETGVSNTTESNQSYSLPNSTDHSAKAPVTPESTFMDMVPEAYRDKPYVQKYKDADAFFGAFDNLQKMAGRPVIPTEDSPPEAWDNFYKQLGRPESADGYKEIAGEIEGLNEAEFNEFAGMAHEMGLTKAQAEKLFNYDVERQKKAMAQVQQQTQQSTADRDAQFDQMGKKMFGDDYNKVIDNAIKLSSKFANQDLLDKMSSADNESLMAFVQVLNGISNEYLSEDRVTARGENVNGASRLPELKEKAASLMKEQRNLHPGHARFDEIQAELNNVVYPAIMRLES